MVSTAAQPRLTSLDNSTPPVFKHLEMKLKTQQLKEERFAEIEHENRVLLEKMSKIMRHDPNSHASQFLHRSLLQLKPGVRVDSHMYPVLDNRSDVEFRSLNREQRVRELSRITLENQQMLQRIQERKPVYSVKSWKEQSAIDAMYGENVRDPTVRNLSNSWSRFPKLPSVNSGGGSMSSRPSGRGGGVTTLPQVTAEEPATEEPAGEEAAAAED
mmetsp:Transcript_13062/g.41271  ORF Transcript_13062/g.41271 Transcript_13062/m.41271 type:complete len:215 (+) Transcript_13062:150-794(+)